MSIGRSAGFSWDGEGLICGHEPGGGGQAQCEATSPVVSLTLFFFDADTGEGLGADAQTGWLPAEIARDLAAQYGATVTLLDDDDKPVVYQIVGQTEADAKRGRISYNSPLGRALIGRKVDEEVEVSVPAGDRYYVVSKIAFI